MPINNSPDPYILVMAGAGLLIALVAWLPLPLSLPIVCIGIGAGLFLLLQITLRPLPALYPEVPSGSPSSLSSSRSWAPA